MLLPKIYLFKVTFKNYIEIFLTLINYSATYFSEDLVSLNQIPDSPIYMYETLYLTKPIF